MIQENRLINIFSTPEETRPTEEQLMSTADERMDIYGESEDPAWSEAEAERNFNEAQEAIAGVIPQEEIDAETSYYDWEHATERAGEIYEEKTPNEEDAGNVLTGLSEEPVVPLVPLVNEVGQERNADNPYPSVTTLAKQDVEDSEHEMEPMDVTVPVTEHEMEPMEVAAKPKTKKEVIREGLQTNEEQFAFDMAYQAPFWGADGPIAQHIHEYKAGNGEGKRLWQYVHDEMLGDAGYMTKAIARGILPPLEDRVA